MKYRVHPSRRHRHRGVTSLLAMLFLMLFSALAIGFYTTTSNAVQISYNDRRGTLALAAAESGMNYIRHHLGRVSIPPGTTVDQVDEVLHQNLVYLLKGTANLNRRDITKVGNTIYIPDDPTQFIALDSSGNHGFRIAITDWAGEIVVKVTGRYATPAMLAAGTPTLRTITMDFTRQSRPATAFNYAVSSKGQVVISRGGILSADPANPKLANVMSATTAPPSISMAGGTVGGDLNIVEGGSAQISSGTVGGESQVSLIYRDHVLTIPPPEFPVPDTAYYRPYATNTYNPGLHTQKNIRIPANTNPQFTGGDTVQGIMYIESPNTVTFRGTFNLQGFIVFENANDTTRNLLDFRGSVVQSPLPSGAQFDPLRVTTGVSVLAPSAGVTMSGSSNSFLIGNVMIGSFLFDGAADIVIDHGTLMTFKDTGASATFTGKNVKFTGIGATNLPTTGLNFAAYYVAKPTSYREVLP